MTNHNKPTTIPRSVIADAVDELRANDIGEHTWTMSDTYDLDDGDVDIEVRLRIEHDDNYTINDYDSDGEMTLAYRYLYGESKTPRPDHFDGRARKLEVDRGLWVWWQPPSEHWDSLDAAGQRKYQSEVRDRIMYGFVVVFVEVYYKCKCCDTWAELASGSLGGCCYADGETVREVLTNALLMADVTITEEES